MHESGENYLETILILGNRNGSVRSVDVAAELGYSKASISRAMGVLRENGYITMEPSGELVFTDKGRTKAEAVYERHRLISIFLQCSLGLSKELADKDACRIEHIVSEETFERIKNYVRHEESIRKIS